jgi:hypothetical protein
MMSDKCANPNTPVEFCLYCGKEVYTCERDESVNNSYLCPVHPNGFEDKYGNWFCNDVCYKEAERIKKKLEQITPSNKELLKMVEDQEKFKVYKSVTELCAENPNLAEYIEQLEKEIDKLRNMNSLKISVEKLVLLHKLVLFKVESEEADKIRNELDDFAKHTPEEQEWMRKLSASLYDLIENNQILETDPIKLKTVGKIKVNYVEGEKLNSHIQQINWLETLGDIQQNESVDGNDIVREVDLHKFKILWSFESDSEAREAFKQWYEQYQDYYDNPENYKDKNDF